MLIKKPECFIDSIQSHDLLSIVLFLQKTITVLTQMSLIPFVLPISAFQCKSSPIMFILPV